MCLATFRNAAETRRQGDRSPSFDLSFAVVVLNMWLPLIVNDGRVGVGGTHLQRTLFSDFDARVENKELETRMRPVENGDAWSVRIRIRTALRLSSARGFAPSPGGVVHTPTHI